MVPVLGGRYQLSDLLASGDAGMVWRALDRGTGRTVAVKVLHPHLAADPRLADRFLRARRELTALWHPGIARLLEVVVDDDALGLVSDLVDGTDVARWPSAYGPMTASTARDVADVIADALISAHRMGMVHGDIKPSNVVIPPPGEGPARLTDFSVAVLIDAGRRAPDFPEPGERPWYRAPEVTRGVVPAPASDVYGLGAVLTEMVAVSAGSHPHNDALLGALRAVASSCLVAEPALRPTAAVVHQRLRALGPAPAPAVGPAPIPHPEPGPAPPSQLVPGPPRRDLSLPGRSGTHQSTAAPGTADAGRAPVPTFGRDRSSATQRPIYRRPLGVALGAVTVVACLVILLIVRAFGDPAPTPPPSAGAQPGGTQPSGAQPSVGAQPSAGSGARPGPPTDAAARSAQGGAEFVRYFFASLGEAASTGDTAEVARLTSPACGACQSAVATIRRSYDNGGSMRGGTYAVRRVTNDSLWSVERPLYEATLDRTPRSSIDSTGAARDSLGPLVFASCTMILEWTGNEWRLLDAPTPGCVA